MGRVELRGGDTFNPYIFPDLSHRMVMSAIYHLLGKYVWRLFLAIQILFKNYHRFGKQIGTKSFYFSSLLIKKSYLQGGTPDLICKLAAHGLTTNLLDFIMRRSICCDVLLVAISQEGGNIQQICVQNPWLKFS